MHNATTTLLAMLLAAPIAVVTGQRAPKSPVRGTRGLTWHRDLDKAFAEARKQKKPLLVYAFDRL